MVNGLSLDLQLWLYQVQQQPCLFLYQNARFIFPALETVPPQPNWQMAKNYTKISEPHSSELSPDTFHVSC